MSSFSDRIIRAAGLDAAVYEEVEADRDAFGQAMAIVIISSICAGIGGFARGGIGGIIGGALAALIGWFIWALLIYWIGAKAMPEEQTDADYGQLLRTIGFASSPGIIRILGIIPVLGLLFTFVGNVWMLIAMVIGVRQALDYSGTGRAVIVCLIGWVVQLIIMIPVALLLMPATLVQ